MKNLADNSIDMILSDLPYNMTDCDYDKNVIDLQKFWQQANRILKPKCCTVLFASSKFAIKLINSNFEQYRYKWVWVKNQPTFFVHAKNAPMHTHEEILIFSSGVVGHSSTCQNRMRYFPQGIKNLDKPRFKHKKQKADSTLNNGVFNPHYVSQYNYPKDILYYDVPFNVGKLHPSQKPTDLLEYLIKTYTVEGETVLDATIGSGSTAVAAINTNRNFIGFEIDEKYFATAQNRIEKAFAEKEQRLFDFMEE